VKEKTERPLNTPSIISRLVTRPMEIDDLDEVLEIEEASFPTPWTMGIFTREFMLEFSHQLVFDLYGTVVGYIVFWLIEGEVHIMSIAVRDDWRRLGIGEEILARSLARAREIGGRYAFLEVRETNSAAIRLYEKAGFVVQYRRRGYYTDTREDALIMARDL
jgi:ribosomal-protein-alanine N-acetyltransferase